MPAPEPPSLLQQWLHEAADRQPDGLAIVDSDRVTTLGELRERSASLAACFRRRGLLSGDRVGLVMEKSTDAVVALFATLMAGGSYVPIQPDWPRRRIDAALEDCEARLVVADDPVDPDQPPSVIDRRSGAALPWAECLSTAPLTETPPGLSPQDPAFILFTSGSTGSPKGVTISHRAVGAFVDWSARQFMLSPGDRIVCPSPLSFDLSTFDVFNIARSGSTCIIAPRGTAWVPRLLLALAREQGVTVWYSVPSLLVRMMERAGLERDPLRQLRIMLFAGEVMPPRDVARLKRSHPQADHYNLYGPTETNVVTWYRVPDQPDPLEPLPIGRPCPYARLQLEPDGQGDGAGLLLVAGDSLMSGYWGRPAETAQAFTDSGDGLDRRRYYRTGDRVALRPDGELLFLVRADRQVKRRGYRIELGEIEAALGSHPEVVEAAVIASADDGGRLTAFVCGRGGSAPSELDLRAHCSSSLPAYMIPDRFHLLAQLPRGDRGKIDYDALVRRDRSSA